MTLGELIEDIKDKRPSEYSDDDLCKWVNEVEFMAVDQVFDPAGFRVEDYGHSRGFVGYKLPDDAETELLIADQWGAVYTTYVHSKIDLANAESDRYALDSAAFEAEWQAFAGWYRRHYKPRRRRWHAACKH